MYLTVSQDVKLAYNKSKEFDDISGVLSSSSSAVIVGSIGVSEVGLSSGGASEFLSFI
jgi:hypothetical protein